MMIEVNENILDWLANGHTGASSKTMAFTTLGVVVEDPSHPSDPSDFNRCLLLVEAAPEVKEAFPKIRDISPQWAAIIDHWDELKDMFVSEVGWNWSTGLQAVKTFRRMRELLGR